MAYGRITAPVANRRQRCHDNLSAAVLGPADSTSGGVGRGEGMSGDDWQPYLGCFFSFSAVPPGGYAVIVSPICRAMRCLPPGGGIKLHVANCRLPGHERRFRKQWPSCRGPPVANGCDYVFMWTELAAC